MLTGTRCDDPPRQNGHGSPERQLVGLYCVAACAQRGCQSPTEECQKKILFKKMKKGKNSGKNQIKIEKVKKSTKKTYALWILCCVRHSGRLHESDDCLVSQACQEAGREVRGACARLTRGPTARETIREGRFEQDGHSSQCGHEDPSERVCQPLSLSLHRQQSQCSLCCPDLFLNEHIASDILALSLSAEASGTALRFRSVSG